VATTAVRAHIAGTVWKVVVAFDDEVEEGQTVAILESMKMEMPVEAPVSGRVTAIHVAPGRFVEEGEPLMDLG
jgi:acetyl-CoA carboxylase biotin carboxyl carrier protein